MQFIDLKAQQARIRGKIDARIADVLEHGRYIMGPEVRELEAQLAEFVGCEHALGCSSGTDALMVPLLALGVGPGDAVFTTPFTFFATCEVIALTGATPVFVDIDADTFNIDPELLAEAVERVSREGKLRPKGIIPVDLFGLAADYDRIQAIADAHDLFVLQDAAQAFGAVYRGKRAPTHGDVGATSFFPAKPLGGYGDGGAIFTGDADLAAAMRSVIVHGQGSDKYNNVRLGLNARIDTMQAAILLPKLEIYADEIERRQVVANRYGDAIRAADGGDYSIIAPTVPDDCVSVWAQYTIRTPRRDELKEALGAANIPTAIYYVKPMHLLDAMSFLGHSDGDFPVSERLANEVLSLPMHPYLSESEQGEILQALGVG